MTQALYRKYRPKQWDTGAVQVHTVAGTDTVIDLYWGIGDAVWNSGEEARLFDP